MLKSTRTRAVGLKVNQLQLAVFTAKQMLLPPHRLRRQRAQDDLKVLNAPQCKLQREGRTLLQGHQGCAASMDPPKGSSGAAAPMKLLLLSST